MRMPEGFDYDYLFDGNPRYTKVLCAGTLISPLFVQISWQTHFQNAGMNTDFAQTCRLGNRHVEYRHKRTTTRLLRYEVRSCARLGVRCEQDSVWGRVSCVTPCVCACSPYTSCVGKGFRETMTAAVYYRCWMYRGLYVCLEGYSFV